MCLLQVIWRGERVLKEEEDIKSKQGDQSLYSSGNNKHGLFDLKGLTCHIVEAKHVPATMLITERKPNANLSTKD